MPHSSPFMGLIRALDDVCSQMSDEIFMISM